jgi:capsular exopolysaccharide synthesis family protein
MNVNDIEEGGGAQKELNIKKYILRLLNRWPIILLIFVLFVAAGYTINRYSTPVYSVKARITTHKYSDKPNTPVPGLVDANFFLSGLTEVYEEIPTLKSPKRIDAALDKLDFRISYFTRGIIKKSTETTKGYGFDVEIDTLISSEYPYGVPIFVNHVSEHEFQLDVEDDAWHKEFSNKTYRFGEKFKLGDAELIIINTNGKTAEPNKYYFVLNRKSELVSEYSRRLSINWVMRGSAMLDLRIDSESPEKDLKFMKAYYQVVEEMGLQEKNETLDNTISFIDKQMAMVTDSLIYYQELIDGLKLDNRKLTLGPEFIYSKLNEIDQKKAELLLNERYLNYLTDYFVNKRDEEVFAPSLIGLNIPLLEGWVNQYVNAKLKDKYQLNTENSLNPLVNREDSLRRKLEKGIYEAIHSARQRNRDIERDLEKQSSQLYGSVQDVQTDFRVLSRYQRMHQLNQTLFDLFLRRKTEAAISKASASSDYKVIDAPSYSRAPIRPDEDMNLIIAAALGFVLPIGFFLIKDITNSRIMDKDDLQSHTQMPMLGHIAHSDYESKLVLLEHPRSVVAESFRAVRANLKYLVQHNNSDAQTFLITSSVGGEGKTFCSLNLAYTLALSGKRTILIAADLRKPQLMHYLEHPAGVHKGLSEYLAGLSEYHNVVVKGEKNFPDYIDAGNVPPNPSELLAGEKMMELIGYLKQHYEYIIIDTPPIGLVSDAMELFKYTDYNILIVRQGVTHKAAVDMINELYVEGKLKNFSVLFNDIDYKSGAGTTYGGGYLYGMGYSGYGYGYYHEDNGKKRFWKKRNS